ncbi:hypothetical protein EK21DRAFT_109882 [Setomelanomma holmii]|uniref:AB hydrolase-1 domain-containing protein n=1 Tax=Setomelanomma holmii TaxID=210430 RepID=A0A9P4HDF1_9PLEO|nr:hypothetical protein EK21DRAFT_109882 [Setomelanomma holmii]
MNSLLDISSYGALNTHGLNNPSFSYSTGKQAVCVSGTIAIPVLAPTVEILYKGPSNNYDLTEFITAFVRRGSDTLATSIGGPSTVNSTFAIYTKLCVPVDAEKAQNLTSVQFLTHDAAAAKGYATFLYDRLGAGQSAHPDPWQDLQMSVQKSIAHALVQKLKAGDIGGITFRQVVGIGHSLGAALTQAVSSGYPSDFDAVALSGHSAFFEGSGTGFAAAAQQIANTLPDRAELKGLPNGYFTLGPVLQTLQFAFFYYPHFDEKIFMKEFETRQTNAIGETLTLGAQYTPTTFDKAVQILNGQQDYFYCQGDCLSGGGDVTADALNIFYPERDANKSEAITISKVGHNVNLHFARLEAFEQILSFISRAGIKP